QRGRRRRRGALDRGGAARRGAGPAEAPARACAGEGPAGVPQVGCGRRRQGGVIPGVPSSPSARSVGRPRQCRRGSERLGSIIQSRPPSWWGTWEAEFVSVRQRRPRLPVNYVQLEIGQASNSGCAGSSSRHRTGARIAVPAQADCDGRRRRSVPAMQRMRFPIEPHVVFAIAFCYAQAGSDWHT
ncbi:unnamed protein product, partial [Prorocentrum cordatum]